MAFVQLHTNAFYPAIVTQTGGFRDLLQMVPNKMTKEFGRCELAFEFRHFVKVCIAQRFECVRQCFGGQADIDDQTVRV